MHWATGSVAIGSGTSWQCDSCSEVWLYDAYSKKTFTYFWTLMPHALLVVATLGLLGRSNGGWRKASFLRFWRAVNIALYVLLTVSTLLVTIVGHR